MWIGNTGIRVRAGLDASLVMRPATEGEKAAAGKPVPSGKKENPPLLMTRSNVEGSYCEIRDGSNIMDFTKLRADLR